MSTTDPATIAAIEAQVWRRARRARDLLVGVQRASAIDEPSTWALVQAVEFAHTVHAVREVARATNQRWAEARGLPPHVWADQVAATWPADPAHPERFERLQRRRLEWALRQQLVWPAEHLSRVVRGGGALARMFRNLLWIDEGEALRWIDDAGRTRDLAGGEVAATELRIAHPTHRAMRALDRAQAEARIDPAAAPFHPLDRERFGPASLTRDESGWYRPNWPETVPVFRLFRHLRRGRWRFTQAEDNGTVAGIFLHDARADLTALWRLMNPQDEPTYGYSIYGTLLSPDQAIRVGLLLLRGAWDRSRLRWSYGWPPRGLRNFGIQDEDLVAPEAADPLFLSEVIRDLWLASRPRDGAATTGASSP